MELHGILIVIIFSAFLGFLFFIGVKNKKYNASLKGKSPINKILFLIGKASMFFIWILACWQAMKIELFYVENYIILERSSVILALLGFCIILIAYLSLGRYTKFGLPNERTELITSGIYKYSRHPMYLGLFLLTISSCLYNPHWLTICLSVVAIFLHHKIVIAEEKFLANEFKEEWDNYKKSVRRYI